MGILSLQFKAGKSAATLGFTGEDLFDIDWLAALLANGLTDKRDVAVKATAVDGSVKTFATIPRIDTPKEALYHRHRNILSYVSRQMI